MMLKYLAVFLGGGIGSILRYGLGLFFQNPDQSTLPLSTFLANIVSCIILGILWGIMIVKPSLSPAYSLFFAVGLCGGFSTFSTFGLDFLQMIEQGNSSGGLFYIFASIILGFLAIFLAKTAVLLAFN